MGYDAELAGLISQDVLAVLYTVIFIGALIMRFGHYHTRTHALSMFATHAIIMSLSRIIYFIVPPSTWGQGDVPTDPDRFSKVWWLQGLNNFFYFAGNVGVIGCYLHILLLWAQAFCVIVGREVSYRQRAITIGFWVYVVFEVVLMALYFATPYSTVLAASAIGNSVLLLVLAIMYVYYWYQIWSSLGLAASNPSLGSLVFSMPNRNSVRFAAHVQEENRLRALDKLHRMTHICLVFTVGLSLKLSVLLYMMKCLFWGFDESTWWLLIFFDYLVAEVLTAASVIFLLRKPVQSALAASEGEDATRPLILSP